MLLAGRGGAAAEAAREGSGVSYRVAATSPGAASLQSVRQSLRTALEARLALAHRAEMVGSREVQRERAR